MAWSYSHSQHCNLSEKLPYSRIHPTHERFATRIVCRNLGRQWPTLHIQLAGTFGTSGRCQIRRRVQWKLGKASETKSKVVASQPKLDSERHTSLQAFTSAHKYSSQARPMGSIVSRQAPVQQPAGLGPQTEMSFSPLRDGFPNLSLPSSGESAYHPPARQPSRSAAVASLESLFLPCLGCIPILSMCGRHIERPEGTLSIGNRSTHPNLFVFLQAALYAGNT